MALNNWNSGFKGGKQPNAGYLSTTGHQTLQKPTPKPNINYGRYTPSSPTVPDQTIHKPGINEIMDRTKPQNGYYTYDPGKTADSIFTPAQPTMDSGDKITPGEIGQSKETPYNSSLAKDYQNAMSAFDTGYANQQLARNDQNMMERRRMMAQAGSRSMGLGNVYGALQGQSQLTEQQRLASDYLKYNAAKTGFTEQYQNILQNQELDDKKREQALAQAAAGLSGDIYGGL